MFEWLRRRQVGAPLWQLVIYAFCRGFCVLVLRVVFRARAHRPENVPVEGGLLLAANHQSYLDPPLVGGFVTRHCHFIARSGLFSFRPFAWLISTLNSIPVRGDSGDAGAIKQVIAALEEGHAVVIFPEGARSTDGGMHEFKRGAALLLKRGKCPVVPVAVEGCFDAYPPGGRPRPFRRVAVMYGTPIPHDELLALGTDGALDRLAHEIDAMRRVLRETMRRDSQGRYPAPSAGDQPAKFLGSRPPGLTSPAATPPAPSAPATTPAAPRPPS
jgi:1-acyl-sn-glycerol-3-phosphate acyltransferase